MIFDNKSKTLASLYGQLITARVLPQFSFSVASWGSSREDVLDKFYQNNSWSEQVLIVRSSALSEDNALQSLAGKFDSVLHVSGRLQLAEAIETVSHSFEDCNENNLIFIQPMLKNVVRSGVVFTREPSTNTPYYVINYSHCGSTDVITSGAANEETSYIAKCYINKVTNSWKKKLVTLCQDLEDKFNTDALDIEFAFDEQENLYLFQVRPLLTANKKINDSDHEKLLYKIFHTVTRMVKPHPYLNGQRSILGVMPDWNPAEIIGIRPNPLALSLYKELITDSTWAYQRNNYGYKQLRSFPLLVSLNGLPYIDVRVSFNSFIPDDIPSDLAEKLVNYYLGELENSPEKHDKVEFDIIFSCYTLDLEERLERLYDFGFSVSEVHCLATSLKSLTNNIIFPNGLWVKDIEKIELLPERRKTILSSNLTKVEKIYWLLEDCKRYGTLPFAGLARAAFIAVQFLGSMQSKGILSKTEYNDFMASLNTVSSNMNDDRTQLSFSAFLTKYGHLRPGTYDIYSPRYDQAPSKYFNLESSEPPCCPVKNEFSLSINKLEKLKIELENKGIDHDVISLFKFIKGAIEGREYAKFVFTHSLSDAIELISDLGDECGIDNDEMAYFDISNLSNAYSGCSDIKEIITESIASGKKQHIKTQQLILPSLVVSAEDIFCFEIAEGEPNYITLDKISAPVALSIDNTLELTGKIVFIPSADPGFDWIFSHDICGLITKYGGVNSHMAIRAGELSIPSVIGAGEVLYSRWEKAKTLELDALNRTVKIIQ